MPSLVVLVLQDADKMEQVMLAWHNAGASGITILDSSGAAPWLATAGLRDDLPLFPGLSSILAHQEKTNRTLFTVVPDGADLNDLFNATEKVVGPLAGHRTGIMFAIPVIMSRGETRSGGKTT